MGYTIGHNMKLLESKFLGLLDIYRFSNKPLMTRDSDALHTIRLQLMLQETYKEVPEFDIKEACYKALCHDEDEIFGSGDINHRFKYFDEGIAKEIQRVTNLMLDDAGLPEEMKRSILEAKDSSIEGWLIRLYDIVDAFFILNKEAWIQHSEMLRRDSEWSLNYLRNQYEKFPYKDSHLNDYLGEVVTQCIHMNSKFGVWDV